jgi:hypothetical protein
MIAVHNVHERRFASPAGDVGALIDGLASPGDRLWPSRWPPMRLDRPLQLSAIGGHGPIQYRVDTYEPGRRAHFTFRGPQGFDGFHVFEVESSAAGGTTLRHILHMNARGPAVLTWPLVFRPLHNALLEDCLDAAARALGETPRSKPWSPWVRMLRRGFRLFARRQVREAAASA